jgi:hypothetical protein
MSPLHDDVIKWALVVVSAIGFVVLIYLVLQ